jgi:hypothetical protein
MVQMYELNQINALLITLFRVVVDALWLTHGSRAHQTSRQGESEMSSQHPRAVFGNPEPWKDKGKRSSYTPFLSVENKGLNLSDHRSRHYETWQRHLEICRLLEQLLKHLGWSTFEVTNLAIRYLALCEGILKELGGKGKQ